MNSTCGAPVASSWHRGTSTARARDVGSLDARAFLRPEVVRDAPKVVGAEHRAAVRRRVAPRLHRQRHRGHRRRERPSPGPNARKRRVGRGSRLHARRRAGDARRGPTASRGARRGSSEHVAPRSSADSRVSRRRASRNARTPRILSSRRRPKCWALSASELMKKPPGDSVCTEHSEEKRYVCSVKNFWKICTILRN